jgi:hypothetical protein
MLLLFQCAHAAAACCAAGRLRTTEHNQQQSEPYCSCSQSHFLVAFHVHCRAATSSSTAVRRY